MRRVLWLALALEVAGTSGCSMTPSPPEGEELSWPEWTRHQELAKKKTAEPRSLEDMKDALALYEPMVKTRPGDNETALGAAEVGIWLAQNATTPSDVRYYARKAYDFACIARSAWGWDARPHWRIALALGYYARESNSRALALIPEMEESCLEAIRHDERVDQAGPHRFLGLLYAQAPGSPTSVGDIEKAMEHLERAIDLYPDAPENHLALAEVLLDEGEEEEARAALETAKSLLEEASGGSESRHDARRLEEKVRELSNELEPAG